MDHEKSADGIVDPPTGIEGLNVTKGQTLCCSVEKLKLSVNREKTKVDRPWKRTFLGYTMTSHKIPRLKVSSESVKRLRLKIKDLCRKGRGRKLVSTIDSLRSVLRGWFNYFKLVEVKNIFEEINSWLRRKLRCIIWRQWKKSKTRFRKLMGLGLSQERARALAFNGRGAWWNAGRSHMNQVFPKRYFDSFGLYSFVDSMLMYRNGL